MWPRNQTRMGRRKGESGREQISRDNALSVRVQSILVTYLSCTRTQQVGKFCSFEIVRSKNMCPLVGNRQPLFNRAYLFPAFSATFSPQRGIPLSLLLKGGRLRFNSRWIRMECHSLSLIPPSGPPLFFEVVGKISLCGIRGGSILCGGL